MIDQINRLRSGPYGNAALGDRHIDFLVAEVERLTALADANKEHLIEIQMRVQNGSAQPECCNRPEGNECCGNPNAAWPGWAVKVMERIDEMLKQALVEGGK